MATDTKGVGFNSLQNISNESSFLQQLNENFDKVAEELSKSVYKDAEDSVLTATLDAGNQDIANVKNIIMTGGFYADGELIDFGNLGDIFKAKTGQALPAGNPDNLLMFFLEEAEGIRPFYWFDNGVSTQWVEVSFAETNTPAAIVNPVTEVSTNTAVLSGTSIYAVNATAGDVEMTLPALANGNKVTINKANSTGGNVIITPTGTTIQGNTELVLTGQQHPSVTLVAGTTEWYII